ncbi:MAG: shikimate dehydrogenase [Chryseobacterium sp. SCN 40-13]|nr:MAG: shikimate dehydrogenase [Chryseobacterium sp. SCN 40-13]
MKPPRIFGLIGRNISYSFSKKYFTDKFYRLMLEDTYQVFDLKDIQDTDEIFRMEGLSGLNVTIPYKEQILPYLDELSEEAQQIGAVNTIVIRNGRKTGHNTDAAGFEKSLLLLKKDFHDSALILGNGGAAKAVQYVFRQMGIPYETVSRKGNLNFENLSPEFVQQRRIIVQCTPVGTFPATEDCVPFPFESLSPQHLVIDLIYNPPVSQFLKNAGIRGATTLNGLYMLEQQAEKAWELWNR